MRHILFPALAVLLAIGLASCSSNPPKPAPAEAVAIVEPPGEPVDTGVTEGAADGEIEAPAPEVTATPEVETMPIDPYQITTEDRATLERLGWAERVGDGRGAWVNVERQEFAIIENNSYLWRVQCATATAGTGSIAGSEKTPLGWHTVSEKFGEGAPWGQVFRSRGATSEIWEPGGDTKEDLVLTRILWLDGLEPGINQGKNADGVTVDSKKRYIYIHGTNGEDVIGTPSSHGCIRLRNDDAIIAFDTLPIGTPVLISENGAT